MLLSLTLPALVLAGGISGIPGLNWLKGFKLRRPPPPPADTIPPAWRTPSRLALENHLLRASLPSITPGPAGLKVKGDPRTLRVGMDPDSGTVSVVPEMGYVALGVPATLPLAQYSGELTQRTFRRQWTERNAEALRQAAAQQSTATRGPGTGLSFKLPSPLPRQVQSLDRKSTRLNSSH